MAETVNTGAILTSDGNGGYSKLFTESMTDIVKLQNGSSLTEKLAEIDGKLPIVLTSGQLPETLNSGQLLVKGNDVYIGNSSSNLSQLALKIDIPEEVLPYVHPSTKQCNYSVPIVDNLTSSSTTSALSAKQGNVLNSKINNMAAPSLKFTKIFENTKTFSKTSSSQTGAYFTTEIVPESTITTWKNSNYFSIYVVSSITGQITSGDYFEVFIGTSYNSSTTQLCYASISAEDGVVSESNRYLYLRGYPSFFRITTSSGQSNYGFPTSISLITTASHTTDRHTATGTVVIYALSFELG